MDGLGKRYMNMILTMTYLSLIFVFRAVQPLICASTVTLSFDKARLWVVARLRPHNTGIRCYDWSQQQQQHETQDFVVASDCLHDRHRRATDGPATLVHTL